MAPVEPEATAHNNVFPVGLFSGQVLLVTALTARVLFTARRAAQSLPPPTSTRTQQPLRRRYAAIFSILAFLSLASVTTFAVLWRVFSYIEWAEKGNHDTPGSLWTGWYGTGEDGVGNWHLGDWISDIDLVRESDAVAVAKPEGFLSTSQHFVGLLAASIFMGVEGHRRSLSNSTIASFVLLATTGSLGYALNLFFVTVLYTPLTHHSDKNPLHDALFTPRASFYNVPIIASLLSLSWLPTLLANGSNIRLLRFGYVAMPLFLAFAPKIAPAQLGRQHTSKTAAHRSYAKVFYALSIASTLMYWKLCTTTVFINTPPEQASIWDTFTVTVGKQSKSRPNRLLDGISTTGQKLKVISRHPAISAISLDVLLTTISLLTWTFTRNIDVEAILDNTVLSFLVSKPEKHVAFIKPEGNASEVEPSTPVTPTAPRRRGRPKKSETAINGLSTPASASTRSQSLRRSTRRKARSDFESDAESTYEPSHSTKKDVQETEADGATTAESLVHGGESTALAMFLGFVGGLGQLAAGALGAEVTGAEE